MVQRGRKAGPNPRSALSPALGQVIRRRREQLRMPQQELAEKAGISALTLIKTEQGRAPGLRVLEGIARALRVMPSTLITEAEELLRGAALG